MDVGLWQQLAAAGTFCGSSLAVLLQGQILAVGAFLMLPGRQAAVAVGVLAPTFPPTSSLGLIISALSQKMLPSPDFSRLSTAVTF